VMCFDLLHGASLLTERRSIPELVDAIILQASGYVQRPAMTLELSARH
jgi:hypothetical protein